MKDYSPLKELARSNFLKKDSSCSEAVLRALLEFYKIEHSEREIHLAAAFGGGIGSSGCVCGAISGAVLGISCVVGEVKLDVDKLDLADEDKKKWKNAYASRYLVSLLHAKFKSEHHVACCKVITSHFKGKPKERKDFCAVLTEEVVEWSAEIIEEFWKNTK